MIRRSPIRRGKKPRKQKRGSIINKLDRAFKAMIRERDRDLGCISCKTGPVEQAGHLVHAGLSVRLPTRWHPKNVNGQCISCNHFKSGNLLEYALNVDEKYGHGTASMLRDLSRTSWKPSREALEKLLEAAKLGAEAYEEIWNFYGPVTERM